MILHLVEDSIIIERVISDFDEVLPARNLFLCFIVEEAKYIKQRECVRYCQDGIIQGEKFDLDSIEKIVIHFLSDVKIDFIEKYIKKKIPVYWIMWGGDFYNDLIASKSSIFFEPYYAGRRFYLNYLLSKITRYIPIPDKRIKKKLEFIRNRVDFFLSTKPEYDLLQSFYPNCIKGDLNDSFFYYPIDTIVEKRLKSGKENNIIIGNSGSVTNNHLYAFKYLKTLNLKSRRVILPLSYGGSEKYKKHVISTGKGLWNDQFQSIDTLLPLDEYNKVLSSSSVCIYSNWRQEAVGNILTVLVMGAKVFLSVRNPLFKYFDILSIKVYPLEEITQQMLDEVLPNYVAEHNRLVILKKFNKEAMHNTIYKLFA